MGVLPPLMSTSVEREAGAERAARGAPRREARGERTEGDATCREALAGISAGGAAAGAHHCVGTGAQGSSGAEQFSTLSASPGWISQN